MPTVPTYTRVAQDNQLPGVQVSSSGDQNAFGANIAQANNNFGNALVQAGEQANNQIVENQHLANLQSVQDALTASTKEMSDYHYNQNDGFLHRQGVNAKGITTASRLFNDAIVNKYSKTLDNDVQRDAYVRSITPQMQAFQNAAMEHEAKENTIALKQSSDAMANTYANAAATSYNHLDIANKAFRMGINGIIANGMAFGKPQAAIDEDVRAYGTDVATKMIQTALSNNDIQGARNVLKEYGNDPTKMDGQTYTALNGAIIKKEIPIKANQISDLLWSKYGLDEKSGMGELRKTFENDPGYQNYVTAYQARLVDERRFKNDTDKKNEEGILGQIWQAYSLTDAQNIIDNSNLSPSKKLYLLNQAKAKFNALEKGTPEQKKWASYELNGGLKKHNLIMREYKARIAAGDEITPEQQTKYDNAASWLNDYLAFKNGGGYNPSGTDNNQSQIFDQIGQMANDGYNQPQIEHAVDIIAPKYGYDPQYFKDNADWDHLNWKTYESGDGE